MTLTESVLLKPTPLDNKIAVEIVDMHKWYGNFHVLRDINMRVAGGEHLVAIEDCAMYRDALGAEDDAAALVEPPCTLIAQPVAGAFAGERQGAAGEHIAIELRVGEAEHIVERALEQRQARAQRGGVFLRAVEVVAVDDAGGEAEAVEIGFAAAGSPRSFNAQDRGKRQAGARR